MSWRGTDITKGEIDTIDEECNVLKCTSAHSEYDPIYCFFHSEQNVHVRK